MQSEAPKVYTIPTQFSKLSNSQVLRAIYVSNLSLNTTIKRISDGFSYCGGVEKVLLATDPSSRDKQVSVVTMEDQFSYATALLLNQLIIGDSSIQVYPYHDMINVIPVAIKPIANYSGTFNRSSEDVIKAFLNAGLFLQDVKQERLINRARKLDSAANVTERVAIAFQFCTGKVRPAESEIPIEITGALNAVKEKATSLSTKVRGSEALKTASESLSRGWDYLKQSFTEVTQEQAKSPQKIRTGDYNDSHYHY